MFINSVAKTRLMKKRTGETVKTNSCQYNDFYIRGYYDRGKNVVNLGCLHGHHLLVYLKPYMRNSNIRFKRFMHKNFTLF